MIFKLLKLSYIYKHGLYLIDLLVYMSYFYRLIKIKMKMKKTVTILSTLFTTLAFSQAPIIYGTFLPVNGTSIKEVWDTTTNIMPMPAAGTNYTWDYSTIYTPSEMHQIDTKTPNTFTIVPNSASTATNAAFIRATKKTKTADSLVTFYKTNYSGLYTVGLVDMKNNIFGYSKPKGTKYEVTKPELIIPFAISDTTPPMRDTAIAEANFIANGTFPVKHRSFRVKDMNVIGYGTLKLPIGTYKNVLCTREVITAYDSIFINNIYFNRAVTVFTRSNFLRNNTFASSVLMFLEDNNFDNKSDIAWYTLPADFGYIKGTVNDSDGTTPIVEGEVWLYRDGGNFTKNDILDVAKIKNDGSYIFDSIPYGYYRVAARPDTGTYQHSLTTYYNTNTSDSTGSWLTANIVSTIACMCDTANVNINTMYEPPHSNPVTLSGKLNVTFPYVGADAANVKKKNTGGGKYNYSAMGTKGNVKGIDIIIKKQPTGSAALEIKTDSTGNYSTNNLSTGSYSVYVDVPGLGMGQTYFLTISNGTTNTCLNFDLTTDSILPTCALTGLGSVHKPVSSSINVYPNPFSGNTTINVSLTEKSIVTMDLYNLLGEKILILDNNEKLAGDYSYSLKQESSLNPGIYFLKFSVNGNQKLIKLVNK